MHKLAGRLIGTTMLALIPHLGLGATQVVNIDEAKVPSYTLPDPLVFADGRPVTTPEQWQSRRMEILGLFEEHVYGRMPGSEHPASLSVVRSEDQNALGGSAHRKEVTVFFTEADDGPQMDLLIYVPKGGAAPVPGVSCSELLRESHSIHAEPAITLSTRWIRNNDDFFVFDNRATERSRGVRASRWPVERILDRGLRP